MSSEPIVVINTLGGNCPVQAEGFISGAPFYFRARGEHWSLSVGGENVVGNPEWYHEEHYGEGPYEAGWMEESEARSFIAKGAALYVARTQPSHQPQGDVDAHKVMDAVDSIEAWQKNPQTTWTPANILHEHAALIVRCLLAALSPTTQSTQQQDVLDSPNAGENYGGEVEHIFATSNDSAGKSLEPRILDLCYTAFMMGASEDTDWFNDTMPTMAELIGIMRTRLTPPSKPTQGENHE